MNKYAIKADMLYKRYENCSETWFLVEILLFRSARNRDFLKRQSLFNRPVKEIDKGIHFLEFRNYFFHKIPG